MGTNCHFDADTSLLTIRLMKDALEGQGFNNTYLMTQPLAYCTSDCNQQGFIALPEFPFGKFANTWHITSRTKTGSSPKRPIYPRNNKTINTPNTVL